MYLRKVTKTTPKRVSKMKKKVAVRKKTWSRLNKSEKKVAIAEDVLAQIRAKTIIAKQGTYLNAFPRTSCDLSYETLDNAQLNTLIQANQVQCECCGIGSLFIAKVNKTNHLKFRDVDSYDSNTQIKKKLARIFSASELNLIEAAFEMDVIGDINEQLEKYNGLSYNYTDLAKKAIKFGKRFRSDEGRLKGIMLNIIANKGTFKP